MIVILIPFVLYALMVLTEAMVSCAVASAAEGTSG